MLLLFHHGKMDAIQARKHVPSITKQQPDVRFYQFPRYLLRKFQYFNPSICDWRGMRWLVVRRRRVDVYPGRNTVTMWQIGPGDFISREQHVKFFSTRFDEHYEDPRAMVANGELYLSCSNFFTRGSLVGQVFVEVNSIFQATRIARIEYGGNAAMLMGQVSNEKNWCWFYDQRMVEPCWRFVYAPAPHHVVVTPHKDGISEDKVKGISWNYGLPRGGTAPVFCEQDGLMWSFFHSSIDIAPIPPRRRYYMGAYAFEPDPPFNPVLCTPKPLLVGSEEDYREPSAPFCVFPCGAILDKDPLRWTVSIGVNDVACARMKMTHEEVKFWCEPVV